MHDKLLQFQRNDVWTLVPRPEGEHIIGTKWIFRNKTNEEGNVIRNKARLVAQGYSQMEGVDYDETFAQEDGELIVAQVYVDDIIFGSTKDELAHSFSKLIQAKFEISMIGELTHFLGLQIRQQDSGKSVDSSIYRRMIGRLLYLTASRPDISYNMGVYARYQANPKESHMIILKRIIKYVKTTANFSMWYSKDTNDVLVGYSKANWAGNADDRKSILGDCFYVGNNLLSWMSTKQNSISLSTVETEYITAGSCCTQLLWMQKLLIDYGIR
ncbi:uncharacterized protein LOC115950105 [Quercus lobata]|uniref:uncharacterized protein LOC115950105 n=1 Tax=Quercus lobata TaxID=97700 RepID=UPI001245F877|nr:uncharacterized protein LOC115950105 [Quercus lobata]